MKRLVILALTLATPALAQAPDSREGVRAACAEDVQRHCSSAAGNPLRMRACILEDPTRLTPRCRDALTASGQLQRPAATGR